MEMNNWPHRTYCTVADEMRQILKHLDPHNVEPSKSILKVLLEELQTIGNRMEAGLEYQSDIEELHKKRKELLKEIKELEDSKATEENQDG